MTSRNYLLKNIMGNLRRNLWLTALFFLAFFAAGPVCALVSLDTAKHTTAPYPSGATLEEFLRRTLWNTLSPGNSLTVFLVVVCAALAAFAGFFYLYSQEKTDFYHSLPVRREKLFALQYSCGFLTFICPYLLNILITLLVGGVYGALDAGNLKAAGLQAAFAAVFFLAVYGAGILAVLLTGNLFAGILGFGAFIAYGPILYLTYTRLNYRFFDTLVPDMGGGIGCFFSPATAYLQAANDYGAGQPITVYLIYGILLAGLLFGAGILVYRKRPSESFHKTIAFKKLEPVIKVCGLPPVILLAAMFFSGSMYDSFFWLVAGVLVLTLIFSAIYDFLCTMDIRSALKPRISTGVILAGLLLILGGYRMDITGVDRYLPREDKIATMSVYFSSINGQFGYPKGAGDTSLSAVLREKKVEAFQDIYALAQKGVEYYEKEGSHEQENSTGTWDPQVQVSCYIGYHLKSGRNVYRMYNLPETEEVVENVGKIYDNWEYRKDVLPTSYIDPANIQGIYTGSFLETGEPLDLSQDSGETLLQTYKGELENLTFAQTREEKVTGYMEIQEETRKDPGVYWSNDYISYYVPVYESFEKTRKLLEEMGNPMPDEISPEEVESVTLSRYVSKDMTELYQEKVFRDQGELEKILGQLTLTEGRYSVGSPVDYDVNVTVQWKDREKAPVSMYLMENDRLSDILSQLEQQNTD